MKKENLTTLLMAFMGMTFISNVNAYFAQTNLYTQLPFKAGIAADQLNNSMILFGGEGATEKYIGSLNQLTQTDKGFTWSALPQKNSPIPVSFAEGIVSRNGDSFMVLGGSGENTYGQQQQQQQQQGNNTNANTTVTNAPLLLQLYNFQSQTWSNTTVANGPSNRQEFTATYNPTDNLIYIYGGRTQNATLSDLWIMNANANNGGITFSQVESPPYSRFGHSASLTSDGNLVIIGGIVTINGNSQRAAMNQALVFDTKAKKWNTVNCTGSLPSTRSSHSAVITPNDEIYIIGGDSGASPRYREYTRSVAKLDTKTWTWTVIQAGGIQPSFRSHASAAILDGKHITFAFGSTASTYYNDLNLLEMSSNNWIHDFDGQSDSGSSGLSTGVIVGVSIACVVLAVIIIFVLWKFQKYIRFLIVRIHNDIWKPRSGEPIWAETARISFQIFFIFLFVLFLVFVIRQAVESPNVVQRIETAASQVETPDVRFCFDGYPNYPNDNVKSTGVACHTDIGYSCNSFVKQLDMAVFEPQFMDNLGNIQCYLFRPDSYFKLTSTSGTNNGSRLIFTMYGDKAATSGRVHVTVYPRQMDPNVKVYNINDDTPVLLQNDQIQAWQIEQLNDVNPNNIYTLEPSSYSTLGYSLSDHRYLQDVGWNYVGFLPITNSTPEVTSAFRQEPPNPNYPYSDVGTLVVSPNSFVEIVDREVKMYTLLNALGFVGGIFGLLIAVQAWLFGFRPRSPWGVVHRWSVGDMKKSLLRGLHDKFKTSDQSSIPLVHPVHKRFSVNNMGGNNNLGYESETQRISRVEERMQVMELLFKAYYVDDEVFRSLDNANKTAPPGYDHSTRGPLFPSTEKVDLAATNDPHQRNNSRFSHMFHRNSINSDSTSHHHLTDGQENVHLRDI
ncbi:hypothetical protein BJ944DRAFT_242482 [Cunninghamella echinulata]|nr:hypothetical protein BJ944DRAFT_242482 [Cunninghamella echinulata]